MNKGYVLEPTGNVKLGEPENILYIRGVHKWRFGNIMCDCFHTLSIHQAELARINWQVHFNSPFTSKLINSLKLNFMEKPATVEFILRMGWILHLCAIYAHTEV